MAVGANKESLRAGCDVISSPDIASRQKPASFGYGSEESWTGRSSNEAAAVSRRCFRGGFPFFWRIRDRLPHLWRFSLQSLRRKLC